METAKPILTDSDLQMICIVILHSQFEVDFEQIACVLKMETTRVRKMYNSLTRKLDKNYMKQNTQIINV